MVNGIGISNCIYSKKDLENLAKFATGVPLTKTEDSLTLSSIASYPLMISGFEGFSWLKNNRKNYKNAFKQVTQNGKDAYNTLKTSGIKGTLRVSDAKEILTNIPSSEYVSKLSKTTQDLYSKAQKFAEVAKLNPKNRDAIKTASSALAQAKAAAYGETAKTATGMFSKAKNALGITKLNQGIKNLAAKSPAFQKCVDAYNNESGTFMLAIEGGVEVATNVVPTFKQLGAKRGFKQLGKSMLKTVASVAGWVAGSAVGTKLGKVVGAALGNTKVGAVIGAIAGQVGSYAVGTVGQHYSTKLANKVLGKSELEKAREEQALAIAEEAQKNPDVLAGLFEMTAQRFAVEGNETADAKSIGQTIKNMSVAEQNHPQAKAADSPMMSREEMAAYAKKLQNAPQQAQVNKQYNGYIPSSTPITTAQAKVEELPASVKGLFNETDLALANAAKYVA